MFRVLWDELVKLKCAGSRRGIGILRRMFLVYECLDDASWVGAGAKFETLVVLRLPDMVVDGCGGDNGTAQDLRQHRPWQ